MVISLALSMLPTEYGGITRSWRTATVVAIMGFTAERCVCTPDELLMEIKRGEGSGVSHRAFALALEGDQPTY